MTTSPDTTTALREQLADGSLAGAWALDPAQSTATLRSKSMWGLAPVKGGFSKLEGSGTISPAGDVTGRIVIDASSVDTKNARRDKHLRSADFFLSEKYPAITFTVEKLTVTSDGVTVSGSLTVRDQTRPISFPATAALAAGGQITLDATVQVDRSGFGLTWSKLGMASMSNTIAVHAVFTRE